MRPLQQADKGELTIKLRTVAMMIPSAIFPVNLGLRAALLRCSACIRSRGGRAGQGRRYAGKQSKQGQIHDHKGSRVGKGKAMSWRCFLLSSCSHIYIETFLMVSSIESEEYKEGGLKDEYNREGETGEQIQQCIKRSLRSQH